MNFNHFDGMIRLLDDTLLSFSAGRWAELHSSKAERGDFIRFDGRKVDDSTSLKSAPFQEQSHEGQPSSEFHGSMVFVPTAPCKLR